MLSRGRSPDDVLDVCHRRRQRGGRLRRAPGERGDRDLSDHARLRDGRARRRLVGRRDDRTSGARCPRWSRCRARPARPARSTARCRPGALTTTFTASQGLLLMIPNMFKIAGRADLRGLPRRRPHGGHARAVDLRRPQRRDGRAHDGLGDALRRPRCRRRRTWPLIAHGGDARGARALPPLLRRLPHLARGDEDRAAHRGRRARDDRRRAGRGPPPARALAPTGRCCAARPRTPTSSSRPARPCNPFYDALPGDRAAGDGPVRRADRPAVPPVRLRRRARRRARGRAHGLGRRRGRGGGRGARRARREGRPGEGPALPPVRRRRPSSRRCRRPSRAIAVLDRTKEPGALGEPLYQDVVTALAEHGRGRGRRPRSSAAATASRRRSSRPAMAAAVFAELDAETPRNALHRRHHRRRDRT